MYADSQHWWLNKYLLLQNYLLILVKLLTFSGKLAVDEVALEEIKFKG